MWIGVAYIQGYIVKNLALYCRLFSTLAIYTHYFYADFWYLVTFFLAAQWKKCWGYVNISSKFVKSEVTVLVISILRNGLLKSYVRFTIAQSKIWKKQQTLKVFIFECRMVLFYTIWKKSQFFFHRMLER